MINLPCWHLSAWKGARLGTAFLLLSLLFVAGSANAEQSPRLTLAAERGSVPAGEPGEPRLVQSGLYRLSEGVGEGLAVSPDGRWLLGLAFQRMYVWQIDSARAVITPANPPMYEHPSLSGNGLAVSPDGRFVFASGPNNLVPSNSALSVWRLNSEAGTLTMTADYRAGGRDAAGNLITGLAGVFDVVLNLNADGSLLFVTSDIGNGGALSVWRVDNSSGALVETEVYESTPGDNSLGLINAAGAALSPDGSLLFIGTFPSPAFSLFGTRSHLSVWRVNAEEDTSTVTVVTHLMTHRDDERLSRPRYVAVSPSGLLLVSSQNSGPNVDSLSTWRADSTGTITPLESYGDGIFSGGDPGAVGATEEVVISAGLENNALFLFRIDEDGDGSSFVERYNHNADAFTYRDGNPAISALQPFGVTASPAGGLVFSSGLGDSNFGGSNEVITAWRVEGIPRVPAGQEVRVTVNADPAPMAALAVTVEARQGSRAVTALATFNPQEAAAQAVFAGGALGPGEWTFTALSASTADVSAARGTVRINSPDVRLENLSGRVRVAESLEIKVIASASLPEDVMVTVRGRRGSSTAEMEGRLSAGQTSLSVTFGDGDISEGAWTFSAVPRLPLVTEADNTTLEVSIGPPLPRLTLELAASIFALHSDVDISVSATGALDSDVTVTVSADSGSASDSLDVTLMRGGPVAVPARFPAGRLDEGTYTIMAGASVDDVAADAVMRTISVRRAVLTLELAEAQLFVSGDAVSIRVLSNLAASAPAEIIVRAVQAGTERTTQVTLAPNTSAVQADFGAGILTAGIWTISASGELDVFTLAGEISVEVLAEPIPLTLSVDQDRVFLNTDFSVNWALERGLPDDLQVTILATHSVLDSTAESIVSIAPDQNMGSASFSLPVPGVWRFTVFNPHSVLDASSAQASVEVILPMLTLTPTEVEYALDSDVIINVSAMPQMLRRLVNVTVRAEREGTDSSFTRSVELTESPSSQATFSGGTLGEGLWNFTAEMPSESGVVAVQGATASAVVRKPVLRLLVSSDTVFVSNGEVRLSAVSDLVPGTQVTITPMAQRQDAPEIQEQGEPAVIAASSTGAEAVFRAGVLSAGEWTIAATSTPDVFARIVTASVTVQPVPILRLVPEQEDPVPGAPFSVQIIPDRLPPQDVVVTVQARQYGLIKTAAVGLNRSAPSLLESGAAAVFEGPNALGVGPWMLTVLPTVGVEVPDELVVWVTVQQQVLGLVAEQVGADVHVLLTANFRRAYDLGIEVRAQRGEDRHERELRLLSTSQQGEVVFEGDVLGIGLWTFSVSRIVPGFVIAPSPVTLTVAAVLAIGTVPQGQVLAGEDLGLIQTDIYCRSRDDCSRSRQSSDSPSGSFDFAEAVIVSPDGRMVVVSASGSLHFWRLDPVAGTLNDRQVIQNSQGSANGLEVPNFASFSPDSRLLFVPSDGSGSSGFLSVWRADTGASALALSVVYQNNQSRPEGLPDEPDEDGDRVIRGLNGAWEAAPSRDGRWLFVTAAASLSAWRVNADTATLQQLAVYCQASDCPGGTGGFGDTLNGMRNLVVSPDNRFVFAAARGGDQLSAWRVEEEGTLALIESEGSDLDAVTEVAVNPEGSLLFAGVTGRDALQIWSIAEDGQISREFEYDNSGGGDRDGYNEIHGLEASPVQGDNLVFTAEIGGSDRIAVRRVNPSSRRLAGSVLVAGQRGGANTVEGLRYTGIDPTGSFLFVTARPGIGILTVWRVEGIRRVLPDLAVSVPVTLNFPLNEDLLVEVTASQAGRTETAQTRLPTGSTMGAVAFSPGDLGPGGWRFAISSVSSDDAAADETRATVRIAQPTLSLAAPETFPAGLPLPLRLETGIPPGMEVQLMLTVTGEVSSFMRELLLGAEETAAEVEIPFSDLAAASGAGSWFLTVSATPPHAVRGEEDISLGVMAGLPLLTLRPLESRYGLAADVPIAVEASAAPSAELTIMVAATRVDGQSSSVLPVPVMLGPSTLFAQASFPAGALAAGQWRFTATAEPSDILQVGREAVVTVASLTLGIMPLQPVYLMTSEVQVRIMSDGDPGSEVLLTATHEDGITRQVAARLPASITSTVIAFSGADMLDTAGLWTLAASAPGVTGIFIGSSAQVRVLTTVITVTLGAEPAALPPGETVTLTLSLDAPAPVPLALGVGVSVSDGSPRPDLEIAVPMDATSGSIPYQLQGSAGTQMFTLRDLGLDFLSVVTSTTTVTVLPPALELLPQDENAPPVSAGSTLGVRISASHAPQAELAVTVQATRAGTPLLQATTTTAVVALEAEETQVMVLFGGANALSPGQWILMITDVMPRAAAIASSTGLRVVVGPAALALSAPSELPLGLDAVIAVSASAALGQEVRVTMTATLDDGPVPASSQSVVLSPASLSAEAVFEADLLTPGSWRFAVVSVEPSSLTTDLGMEFPLVDFAAASLVRQIALPVLILEMSPAPVEVGRDVPVVVRVSAAVSQLQVIVTATQGSGDALRTRQTTLAQSSTMATVAFGVGGGDNDLSPGIWVLTATAAPPGAALASSPLTLSVPEASLRLERLGPVSVAAGTAVRVRITAEGGLLAPGLSLEVSANHLFIGSVRANAVADENGQAEAEFSGLSPGEWLLSAVAAGQPSGGAADQVFVETFALTLMPRQPTVAATAAVVLFLGTPIPLGVEVSVEVTARSSSSLSELTKMVALAPDTTSTELVYEPGELTPGEWNFTVQASTSTRMVVDISAATATLQVDPAPLRLAALQERYPTTERVVISIMADVPPGRDVMVTVEASQADSGMMTSVTVVFQAEQNSAQAVFDAGQLEAGRWTFRVSRVSPEGFLNSVSTATANVVSPVLSLNLPRFNFLMTEPLETQVSLDIPPGTTVTVTVRAEPLGGQGTGAGEVMVDLLADGGQRPAVFPANTLAAGSWRFVATGPALTSSTPSLVYVLTSPVTIMSLTALPMQVLPGGELTLSVTLEAALQAFVDVQLTAMDPDARERTPVNIRIEGGDLSGSAAYILSSRAGDWHFEVQTGTVVSGGAAASATVRPPQLTLERLGDREVAPGSVVAVRVSAEAPPAVPVVLTLRASQPGREERQESVELDGENLVRVVEFQGLPPGEWTFSAMAEPPELAPAGGATRTVVVRSIVLELQPGMPVLPAGSPVPIMVMSGTTEPGVDLRITVLADPLDGQDAAEMITIFLAADANSATGEFAAGQLGPGSWAFSGTVSSAGVATVLPGGRVRLEPVLALAAVQEESTVRVTVTASAVPHTTVTVAVLATLAADSARTETASLALADNSMGAVAFGDAAALEPGLWLFTMTATPTEVVNTDAELEFTVLPALTLRLVGPAERSLGSPVRLALGVSHELSSEILLTVTASQEGAEPVQRNMTLERGAMDTEVLFEGDVLSVGRWIFTATATPNDLLHTVSARAEVLVRPALLELVAVSGALVFPGEIISFELRLTPALNTAVSVRVTAQSEGRENPVVLERSLELAPGTSSLPFSVDADELGDDGGAGRWLFVARSASSGAVDDSGAEQAVIVGVITVSLSVPSLGEGEEVFPGDAAGLLLSASYEGDSLGLELPLAIEVAAANGSPRDSIIIQVSADTSMGSFSFIPDVVPGIWTFTAGGSRTVPEVATVAFMVSRVMSLDFSAPSSDGVRADDLTLLLRYLKLCVQGQDRPLPVNCDALGADDREINLARNLGEPADYRFADLPALERLPDLTGNGTGDVDDLVVLLGALSGVRESLLVPAAPRQAQDARMRMIRQLLER